MADFTNKIQHCNLEFARYRSDFDERLEAPEREVENVPDIGRISGMVS